MAVVALLLLTGCVGSSAQVRQDAAPAFDTAEGLLDAMAERRNRVETLNVAAHVDATGRDGKVKGRLLMAARMPNRIRMDVLSFFDQPVSTLCSNGTEFSMFETGSGRYYFGPATPENLARLIPIPLESEQIAALLVGTAAVPAGAEVSLHRARSGRLGVLLRGGDAPGMKGRRLALTFDGEQGDLLRAAFYDRRGVRVAANLSDHAWEESRKLRLPGRVEVRVPRKRLSVRLRYRDAFINEEMSDEAFVLLPPKGATRIFVPGPDGPRNGAQKAEKR